MNPNTKIFFNGKLISRKKYVRNDKGEFTPLAPRFRRLKLIFVAIMLYAIPSIAFTYSDPISYTGGPLVPIAKAAPEPLPAIMERIADCESGGGKPGGAHQFNKDGSVVMNPNKGAALDAGYMQINLSPEHVRESTRLGMDVFTEKGNKAYGMVLFNREGTAPWNSSINCWARTAPKVEVIKSLES